MNKLSAACDPMAAPRQPLAFQLEETNDVLCEAVQMAAEIRAVLFGEAECAETSLKEAQCIENICRSIDSKARDVRSELRGILERLRG